MLDEVITSVTIPYSGWLRLVITAAPAEQFGIPFRRRGMGTDGQTRHSGDDVTSDRHDGDDILRSYRHGAATTR